MSTPGYYRIEALQRFETIRRQARFSRLGRRLAKRPLTLLPFEPVYHRLPAPNGIPRGLQDICVAHIVGSLDRAADFDRLFRPLHNSQRERWVNVWVMHKLSGWPPIEVRRVGNLYFVEDGHHRTSVARASGLSSIAANVTEYQAPQRFDPDASLAAILASLEHSAMVEIAPAVQGWQRDRRDEPLDFWQ